MDLKDRDHDQHELVLDLGAGLDQHVAENFMVKHYIRDSRCTFANAVVRYKEEENRLNDVELHRCSHVHFSKRSPHASDMSLIVFGDSYSEHRGHALTGLLAELVRELDFVWSAQIDWDLVGSIKPNVVLSQLAERFHVEVPSDSNFSLLDLEGDVMLNAVGAK